MKKSMGRLLALVGILAIVLQVGSCIQRGDMTPSSDASIKPLELKYTLDGKALTASFTQTPEGDMAVAVDYFVETAKVFIKTNHSKATLNVTDVKGNPIPADSSDSNLFPVNLVAGANNVLIATVTAEDGKTQEQTGIIIYRASLADAGLNLKTFEFNYALGGDSTTENLSETWGQDKHTMAIANSVQSGNLVIEPADAAKQEITVTYKNSPLSAGTPAVTTLKMRWASASRRPW